MTLVVQGVEVEKGPGEMLTQERGGKAGPGKRRKTGRLCRAVGRNCREPDQRKIKEDEVSELYQGVA